MSNTPSTGISNLIDKKLNDKEAIIITDGKRDPLMKINPAMPWAKYEMPHTIGCDVNLTRVKPNEQNELLLLVLPDGKDGPAFSDDGLRLLGHQTGFKVDFVNKLSIGLRAEVINEMMRNHRSQQIQFIGDSGLISEVSPGWRDICGHAEILQTAYETMVNAYKKHTIEVIDLVRNGEGVSCKFITNRSEPITRKVGDELAIGIKIEHRYGVFLRVGLFSRRLVCLNGMVRDIEGFSWTNRKTDTIDQQLDYIVMSINDCSVYFDELVAKAKDMANTIIQGDPRDALIARARNMKIPEKLWPEIVGAYDVEGGDTEWSMLNALTRFATHNEHIDGKMRETIFSTAGAWVYEFDMVNARLPRPMAEKFGAQIIEDQA